MNQRGLTLIELTIATALLASGILTATMSYTAISKLQQKGVAVREVQQTSRYILDQIERDVRNAAVITTTCSTPLPAGTCVHLTNSTDTVGGSEEYSFTNVSGHYDLLRCATPAGAVVPSCAPISDQNIHVLCPGGVTPPNPCNMFEYHGGKAPFLKIDMQVAYDPNLSNIATYAYTYDLTTNVSPRDQ